MTTLARGAILILIFYAMLTSGAPGTLMRKTPDRTMIFGNVGVVDRILDEVLFERALAADRVPADMDDSTLGKASQLSTNQRATAGITSRSTAGLCARLPATAVANSLQTTRQQTRSSLSGSYPQQLKYRFVGDSRTVSTRSAVADPPMTATKIPVTVVTGFLGSGKTTLLNNILTKSHGKRIAVIENEFGEIGIDQDLVAAAKAGGGEDDSIMMLNNGCLCCTVRGDLVEMLVDLTTNYRGKFDHIVIETTGMASISPIIQTFYAEPEIDARTFLDGVVTLVDAKHITRHLNEGGRRGDGSVNEAMEQIAYADRIVLNKIDLVNASELSATQGRIRGLNGMAEITQAEKAAVGVDYVLGVGGFDLDRIEAEGVEAKGHDHGHEHSHDHDHEHPVDGCNDCEKGHHHHHHVHSDRVGSISINLKGDLDYSKLNQWLSILLQEIHEDLYRMKGILAIYGSTEKFVFQGVHQMFDGTPHEPWKDGEERHSKMVFIGKDLPQDIIQQGFEKCLATKTSKPFRFE